MSFQFNGISSEVTISGEVKAENSGAYTLTNDNVDVTTANVSTAGGAGGLIYAKAYEKTIINFVSSSGLIRTKIIIANGSASSIEAQIYKNDLPFGTERTTNAGVVTFIEDLAFNLGDKIQIYIKRTGANNGTLNTGSGLLGKNEAQKPGLEVL